MTNIRKAVAIMANKVTKRDYFNQVIALATEVDNNDLIAFAKHEIELLDNAAKRKADHAKTKPSNGDKTFEAISPSVLMAITNVPKSAKEIADEIGVTPYQKVSPVLTRLAKDGAVVSSRVKGKTVYTLPVAE